MFEAEYTPMAKLGLVHPSMAMFVFQPLCMPMQVRTETDVVAVLTVVTERGLQFATGAMTTEWRG